MVASAGVRRFKIFSLQELAYRCIFNSGVRQYWAHCRWVNPLDPRDLCLMSEKLSRAQRAHIELCQCTLDRLQHVVARLQTPSANPSGDDSGSGSDSDASDQPTICKSEGRDRSPQVLPSFADFGRLPFTSGPGLPPFLPQNQSYDGVSQASFLNNGFLVIIHSATVLMVLAIVI
jgi:hypothetical protein